MSLIKIVDLNPQGPDPKPLDWTTLNVLKERMVGNIKEICYSGIFKHPTGHLANSIRGYVTGNSIYIISDATYAREMEKGVQAHVMWYLLNRTIPIRTHHWGQSEVIYRRATLKSYLQGKWRHPGISGTYFMEAGINTALKEFSEELSDFRITTQEF